MSTLQVLVIDDEQGMRLGIERSLRNFQVKLENGDEVLSFEVEQAETAEEGMKKIEASKPHILLLDNKLPGMSGIELLEQILDQELEILTIMITAYASIETAVRATKGGAYDFLPKPFTPAELKNVVRKAANHIAVTMRARELEAERRKVRFQFISVLAHELKSPINAVDSYLQIMREGSAGDDPEVYKNMVDRSLRRIEYMRKLITDLLDMTRIESGQRDRQISPVDLKELAQVSIDAVESMAAERGISIHLEEKNGRKFSADPSEIEIILNNLVSNAVKYNRDGGRVDVSIDFDEDAAYISVSDTGIGMSEEEREKLFHDFVRIKKKETMNILGSGLGLSIVKKIIDLYDGSVRIDSTPGEGSTFHVTLMDRKGNDESGQPGSSQN
jgi:signal transduction histidine kinase